MREKKIIKIGKVNENFGWLGNMGKREIIYKGKKWISSEGLFISMRFDDEDIIEMLRKEDNELEIIKLWASKEGLSCCFF